VSVEATVTPQDQATPRRAPGKPRKRSARKKSS
jgi:hypothetical protein